MLHNFIIYVTYFVLCFEKNKMQVDQEEQKSQTDGLKENMDKKSDTEDMEVTKRI